MNARVRRAAELSHVVPKCKQDKSQNEELQEGERAWVYSIISAACVSSALDHIVTT